MQGKYATIYEELGNNLAKKDLTEIEEIDAKSVFTDDLKAKNLIPDYKMSDVFVCFLS